MINKYFKILIVDDSKMMRTNISEYLAAEGFSDVDCADDGEVGINFYDRAMSREERYDLIILDVQMPNMTGLEVLELIRKRDQTTKIMMLTTESDLSTVNTAIKHGANGYLLKPFDHDQLMSRDYKHIANKQLF